jgi:uncharacterized protein YqgQ
MAKSLLSVKSKKKPVPRQPKYTDVKFTGDEPVWTNYDQLNESEQRVAWLNAFSFYNYYNTPADMRKYVVQYATKYLNWGKAETQAFAECEDQRVGQTLCSYCKCVLMGAPEQDYQFVKNKIAELLTYGMASLDRKMQAENRSQVKRTVQDHMREKQQDIMGDLEHMYDQYMSGAEQMPDFMQLFRERNMPQQFVGRIRDYYADILSEVLLAKSGADADLKEGYAWAKKADVKRMGDWHIALGDALDAYGAVKKATRAVRKPRPVSKEKQVKKVRYQAEFKELNLVSINPVDIIGCQQLWIYNTRTRKLGRYQAAADAAQMNIRGSTIIGYDEKLSVAKTLRKPAEQLKSFSSAGKVLLRGFLDQIKTTGVQLNGRLNADTILLKAVK